ncbi:MAG: MOSC domain-containing protein [Candidatus Thermoplasmatota archaeon]|nr:MOSC domain-containing protein [Candidatus Thermoplasmatota archaeon]MDA8143568.1 MOSC domain-containing protein [Thermoplasmatales archaeon]
MAVSRSSSHNFSKAGEKNIRLIKGQGVEGDAHFGTTVKHRSQVAIDPSQPNLRQVHLVHSELFAELKGRGYDISPGDIGENITTAGIELLSLPAGTRLHIGESAVIEITGLRNPCNQLNNFSPGLMNAVLDRDENGNLIRKAGIMGIVLQSGDIVPGDEIKIQLPSGPHRPLEIV